MTAFVVDTNVAIVANGRGTDADARCQLTCVERLRSLAAREVVAIDDGGSILEEYKNYLNFSGMPGVGDVFLKHEGRRRDAQRGHRRPAEAVGKLRPQRYHPRNSPSTVWRIGFIQLQRHVEPPHRPADCRRGSCTPSAPTPA